MVRVQSPVKDDGPAIDVEILEREYFPPIFKELVVQSATSSQREKKVLVRVDSPFSSRRSIYGQERVQINGGTKEVDLD